MKNIQIIDGANNCKYDVFSVSDEEFNIIFPDGRDVEFIDDLIERIGEVEVTRIFVPAWERKQDKKTLNGIHGTLFYELEFKKQYYPTRKEAEMPIG